MSDDILTAQSEAVLKEYNAAEGPDPEADDSAEVDEVEQVLRGLTADPEERREAREPQETPSPETPSEWTAPTQEEWEAIRERASLVDAYDERMRTDPATEIARWYEAMPDHVKASILQNMGMDPSALAPEDPLSELDPEFLSPVEQVVHQNREFLTAGPAVLQQMQQEHAAYSQQQMQSNFEVAVLAKRLDAIAEAMQMAFPTPDVAKVAAAIQSGKSVYEAVDAVYGPEVKKAKNGHARPMTPRNRGESEGNFDAKGMDFSQIAVEMKRRGLV